MVITKWSKIKITGTYEMSDSTATNLSRCNFWKSPSGWNYASCLIILNGKINKLFNYSYFFFLATYTWYRWWVVAKPFLIMQVVSLKKSSADILWWKNKQKNNGNKKLFIIQLYSQPALQFSQMIPPRNFQFRINSCDLSISRIICFLPIPI